MNPDTGRTASRPTVHVIGPTSLVAVPLLLLLPVLALAALATTPRSGGRPVNEWEVLIRAHLARYPRMEPIDLYKLLHQAVLGSEHAISDAASVRDWLESELATMGTGPAEPMIDSLRADGRIVRIHLRPFAAAGGDSEALLQAFIGTAAVEGSRGELSRALEVAIGLARARALPWSDSAVSGLFSRLAAQGYPAVHHSVAFREHYRPAYRVVAGQLLRDVVPTTESRTPGVGP